MLGNLFEGGGGFAWTASLEQIYVKTYATKSAVLYIQSSEVKRYPGPFLCIVQSLAGVRPGCFTLKLLYD